jgi:serine/threonine protein kinase
MRSSYEREMKAFTTLAKCKFDSSSFLHCFGTFDHLSPSGHLTFNIIIEYGEYDLREYFTDIPLPVSKDDICGFWKSLSGIADSLHQLHGICGVHGDIKPDNILRNYGSLKLGDFGFTEFSEPRSPDPRSKRLFRGGTTAYGMYLESDCLLVHLLTAKQQRQNCFETR